MQGTRDWPSRRARFAPLNIGRSMFEAGNALRVKSLLRFFALLRMTALK
jgi:hypothetical protein